MPTLAEVPLRDVPVVEPSTSLAEVIYLLEHEPLRTVVLVGDEQYMGVFNEEALQPGLIPVGIDPATLGVGPYVHPQRVIGHPQRTVEETLAQMRRKRVEVIPVVDGTIYKGVVTRADLEAL